MSILSLLIVSIHYWKCIFYAIALKPNERNLHMDRFNKSWNTCLDEKKIEEKIKWPGQQVTLATNEYMRYIEITSILAASLCSLLCSYRLRWNTMKLIFIFWKTNITNIYRLHRRNKASMDSHCWILHSYNDSGSLSPPVVHIYLPVKKL